MRLLFGQNLSPHPKRTLRDLYSDSVHARDVGLESADDFAVWAYARDRRFIIVSKDSDYRQLSFAFGHPPKVIWIRRGNCSTSEIAAILRHRFGDVTAFVQGDEAALLALS